MGAAYGKLKKYQKAIDAFKKAIFSFLGIIKYEGLHNLVYRVNPKRASKNADYQKAIDAYKRTIEIKPDFHEAYSSMGAAYGKLKKYQKAIDAFVLVLLTLVFEVLCHVFQPFALLL
jgi:tetratricopeptide (TPR) repeat protein